MINSKRYLDYHREQTLINSFIKEEPADMIKPAKAFETAETDKAEVVAWRTSKGDGKGHWFVENIALIAEAGRKHYSPLYATPVAPADAGMRERVLAAVSRVCSRRDDLGNVHYIEIADEIVRALPLSTEAGAHPYAPSPTFAGDCDRCGNTADHPWHARSPILNPNESADLSADGAHRILGASK